MIPIGPVLFGIACWFGINLIVAWAVYVYTTRPKGGDDDSKT